MMKGEKEGKIGEKINKGKNYDKPDTSLRGRKIYSIPIYTVPTYLPNFLLFVFGGFLRE